MQRILFASFAFALAGSELTAAADAASSGKPTATEAPLVARMAADLSKRFPTPADAVKAGYMRYTAEDDTGAISYANRHWTSADLAHPSQLWYDVKGRLLGADVSVPATSSKTPPKAQFGFLPSRWQYFELHDHYVLRGAGGKDTYGGVGPKKIRGAGGDPNAPRAADLVKAGVVKKASDVRTAFLFPAVWDAAIWVIPNPSGAFAETNPNVTPSAAAKHEM